MKRMLMLATTAAMIEQFNKNNILILEDMGYEVHVAGNFENGNPISSEKLEEFKQWLAEHNGRWFHIPATRKPTDLSNYRAYKQIVGLVKEYCYEFIHCHTPIGSVIGRCAAHKTHTKIIYTAHGFHFYKGAPIKNWLFYFPAEWICSWWTDVQLTINTEDYQFAKKHLHAKKTEYIPGIGIDLDKYNCNLPDRSAKRMELGVSDEMIMLLSVGELIERKNHAAVLKAMAEMKNPRLIYFVCGTGILEADLKMQARELGIEKQVVFLGFRNDISELCQAADLFVFPSRQEGLSVALMEAIACKTPVICSRIRGNIDLIKNDASMFECDNAETLADCLRQKLSGPGTERENIYHNMEEDIKENYCNLRQYNLAEILPRLKTVYDGGGDCPKTNDAMTR